MGGSEPEAVIPVRVTREVVEVLGTPEQIARSGLTHPGGEGTANEVDAAGVPVGVGGVVMELVRIAAAIEAWAVWVLHKLLFAGALHPRLVLWIGSLLWLAQVTS